MFLRNKHANVIIYSSIVIAIVLVSTLAGYTLYIQWKEDSFALKYRNSIYKITAEMFRPEIVISNASAKISEGDPFAGMPVFEGSIKNNSAKTLSAVTIELVFRRGDGSVIYRGWLSPIGENGPSHKAQFPGEEEIGSALMPGEGMSFRFFLKNCPREIASSLPKRSDLSKNPLKNKFKLEYSVVGVSVR